MVDVRINGKRYPILQAIDNLESLVQKIDVLGTKNNSALTSIKLNNKNIDLENADLIKYKLDKADTIDALLETNEQLALHSLQIAQEMAELLVFDLKVATLNLWDNTRNQSKALETLLKDCKLFLLLAAKPIELLGENPYDTTKEIEKTLRQLDYIAQCLEDAIILAVNNKHKDSCHILVARVMRGIEQWLGLSIDFADSLSLNKNDFEYSTILNSNGNNSQNILNL